MSRTITAVQLSIFSLLGTAHVCPKCGAQWNCDESECQLGKERECEDHSPNQIRHSLYFVNAVKRGEPWAVKVAEKAERLADRFGHEVMPIPVSVRTAKALCAEVLA